MSQKPQRARARAGEAMAFISKVMEMDTDDCIWWPYGKHSAGYGVIARTPRCSHGGYAHRLVCELAHGKQPKRKPHAAHSCGNGHLGCVNWKHLHWATVKQNAADRRTHGTQPIGEKVGGSKLTEAQVLEICELRKTLPAKTIAAKYGISFKYVYELASTRRSRIAWKYLDRDRRDYVTP